MTAVHDLDFDIEVPEHNEPSESLGRPYRLSPIFVGISLGMFSRLVVANGFVSQLESSGMTVVIGFSSAITGIGLLTVAAQRDRFGAPLAWITGITALAWGALNWMSPPFASSVTVWNNSRQAALALLGVGNGLLLAGLVVLAFVRRRATLTVAITMLASLATLLTNTVLLRQEWPAVGALGIAFGLMLLAWDRSPRHEPIFVEPERAPRISRAALSLISVALTGTALQHWVGRDVIPRALPAVLLCLPLIAGAFASLIRVRREIEKRDTAFSEWRAWWRESRSTDFRAEMANFEPEEPRPLSFPNLTVTEANDAVASLPDAPPELVVHRTTEPVVADVPSDRDISATTEPVVPDALADPEILHTPAAVAPQALTETTIDDTPPAGTITHWDTAPLEPLAPVADAIEPPAPIAEQTTALEPPAPLAEASAKTVGPFQSAMLSDVSVPPAQAPRTKPRSPNPSGIRLPRVDLPQVDLPRPASVPQLQLPTALPRIDLPPNTASNPVASAEDSPATKPAELSGGFFSMAIAAAVDTRAVPDNPVADKPDTGSAVTDSAAIRYITAIPDTAPVDDSASTAAARSSESDAAMSSRVPIGDLDDLSRWLAAPDAADRVDQLLLAVEAMPLAEFDTLSAADRREAQFAIGGFLGDAMPTADVCAWIDGPYFIVAHASVEPADVAAMNDSVSKLLRGSDGVHVMLRPAAHESFDEIVDQAVVALLTARRNATASR